jgi:hypothetical protein
METFTQPKIKGYRQLSEQEALTINEIKDLAEKVGLMVESLNIAPGVDKRWVAIARTQLQQGFMALTRAIAQPTTF